MRIRIGLSILWHNRWHSALSALGIGVAVLIMQVQLGFYFAIADTQSHIATRLNADFVISHANLKHLDQWRSVDATQLSRARAVNGVAEVIPLFKSNMNLRHPDNDRIARVVAYAFPVGARVFSLDDFAEAEQALRLPGTLLFDRESRPLVGSFRTGDTLEVNGHPHRLVGEVALGPNIVDDATLFMGLGTWSQLDHRRNPHFALLRLAPGAAPGEVRSALIDTLDGDLRVQTPAELEALQRDFIAKQAPIGAIFGTTMMFGLLIGTLVCYQILYVQILDNRHEYATLRAMGMQQSRLYRDVLEMGLALALAGILLAQPLTALAYEWIRETAALRVTMDAARVVAVAVLTLVGCTVAGQLAFREIARQDTADVA